MDVPVAQLKRGGAILECQACGHGWIEARATEVSAEPSALEATPDIQNLMLAARQARETFAFERRTRQLKTAAWANLLLLALTPPGIAFFFPEQVVATAPASIAFYEALGKDVNIYGIAIRSLTVKHLRVDHQPMIELKGELINISNRDRKSPWLRFGLRDEDYLEVYSWQLNTGAQSLKPGQSRSFATKLASPPQNASKVEIRFARADEIGSNTFP